MEKLRFKESMGAKAENSPSISRKRRRKLTIYWCYFCTTRNIFFDILQIIKLCVHTNVLIILEITDRNTLQIGNTFYNFEIKIHIQPIGMRIVQ